MRRVVFIVNPEAGNGRALHNWTKLQHQFKKPVETFLTEYPRHGVELGRNIASQQIPTLIVVFGGDGTVHEVIEGCIGSSIVEVTAVASGSGNDFGRTFTSVKTKEDILDIVNSLEKPIAMRIGSISTPSSSAVFVNNAGYGFDAKVVYEVNRSTWKKRLNKWRLGKLAYYGVVIKELITYQPSNLQVQVDGVSHRFPDAWFVVICNQPYFGGGMKISPLSKPHDDILEVTVVAGISRWKLLVLFGTVFIGWHTKLSEVHQFSGRSIRFCTDQPLMGHADGEYCGVLQPGVHAESQLKNETWAMPVK